MKQELEKEQLEQLEKDLELIDCSTWTYRIIRSSRYPDREEIVETGIVGYGPADEKRNALKAEYRQRHPEKTSWTTDLFLVELERDEDIRAALHRMRIRRCNGEVA